MRTMCLDINITVVKINNGAYFTTPGTPPDRNNKLINEENFSRDSNTFKEI